ncbi:MAG: hypothetical protein OEX18_07535 [Candidatus Krumholzibacteria bacterium]|nr:hypothetical protein [Candidatus Krumholzibacteria bacterium]MDH4337119.1 hypothetical protein [Candidatus Krumholzibacteria bacterium]MDH5271194.1 hypothetical protein [Candidatus Krumholzibacteria bacterium]
MRMNRLAVLALAGVMLLPALASGEMVRLRDGSSLRGRLLAVEGDSLILRLAIGPRVKVHRAQVLAIVFDDSLAAAAMASTPAGPGVAGTPEYQGMGNISVAFKDRRVSSKISIKYKKDWDAHVRSNDIVMELLLDGERVYSVTDSTTDKTIYQGHITQLKNDMTLEDFSVEVPAGRYQLTVVVRNADETSFASAFDPAPLHAAMVIDELEVRTDRGARVEVGIDRGLLKAGKARLYRVE